MRRDLRSGRDLEVAYGAMSAASPSDRNLFSALDSAWLDGYAGARALKLGRTTEAAEIYEAVLSRTDARLVWERTVALTQLATVRALEGEMEHACRLLTQAVEMAAATGNTSGVMMALRVREQQLARWRSDPCVRQVDELFRSVPM